MDLMPLVPCGDKEGEGREEARLKVEEVRRLVASSNKGCICRKEVRTSNIANSTRQRQRVRHDVTKAIPIWIIPHPATEIVRNVRAPIYCSAMFPGTWLEKRYIQKLARKFCIENDSQQNIRREKYHCDDAVPRADVHSLHYGRQ